MSSALTFSPLLAHRGRATHKPTIELRSGGWQHLRGSLEFGTPSAGGHKTMQEVLTGAKQVSDALKSSHGLETPIQISAHFAHELAIEDDVPGCEDLAKCNAARAISINEWRHGVRSGIFAPIGNMVPGNFGFPWSREGGLTNPDPKRQNGAKAALLHAFRLARQNADLGLGSPSVIYWDGEDQMKAAALRRGEDPILSYVNNPKREDWRQVTHGLADVVRQARGEGLKPHLLAENKGSGDPGATSQFTDNRLWIQAIGEINQLAGCADDPSVFWQAEMLHLRLAGETGARGLELAILCGVFDGQFHMNIGKLGSQYFPSLLTVGTPMSQFATHLDPDWLPGEGPEEWVQDQRETLALAALWSATSGKPFQCEFDAKWVREPDVDAAFLKGCQWTLETFNEEAKALGLAV